MDGRRVSLLLIQFIHQTGNFLKMKRFAVFSQNQKTFIPYGKAPQKKTQANVPAEFLDTFEVEGSIEGLKDMLK